MGLDTKGIIMTDCRDVFLVREKIMKALKEFKTPRTGLLPGKMIGSDVQAEFILGDKYLIIHFGEGEDRRRMFVYFSDEYNERFSGKKIILSIGYWGNSEKIVRTILEECLDLGRCFLQNRDDREEYRYITEKEVRP